MFCVLNEAVKKLGRVVVGRKVDFEDFDKIPRESRGGSSKQKREQPDLIQTNANSGRVSNRSWQARFELSEDQSGENWLRAFERNDGDGIGEFNSTEVAEVMLNLRRMSPECRLRGSPLVGS